MSKRNLTIIPTIHWHEGMMLTPQHFQQMEFRQYQHLSHQLHLLSNHHWGVNILQIDPISINEGLVRILEIEAVMPDGLIVNYRSDMTTVPPLEIDISSFKPNSASEEICIFLSMPERTGDRSPITGDLPRYVSIDGDPVKDENLPDNVVQIPRLFPHLILSVGTKPPAMCQGFPLLKLIFDETYIQTTFIPPCFYITHDTDLWKECAELAQHIREKAMYLSGRWQNQIGTPLMAETEIMLRPLVAALPSLEAVLNELTINPYLLFQKICDVAGHLATLRLNQLPPILKRYDHNDIQESFALVLELIHEYLGSIEQSYSVVSFHQRERLFYLKFHKNYLSKTFLVGLRVTKGMTESQMEEWLMEAVICSDFAVELVRNHRITGAKRVVLSEADRSDLMPGRGMVVAEITYDSEYIAPEQNLNIFNPSDTADRRPNEVVAYIPKTEPREGSYYR
jgi:type VI secretion system protein ImpJ